MALIYSGISPGSVPVESLFSCAGFLLNSRASTTAPYKADTMPQCRISEIFSTKEWRDLETRGMGR